MANSPKGESVLERVVRILETFSAERTSQTVSDIGRRADLPSSTAHRMAGEMVRAGLLERGDENQLRLGMRLWELALRGSTVLRLRQAALPHMETVQQRIGEHTQLAVMEQGETLFLERLSAPSAGANIARVAGRLPLHASSSGLVLLAHADPAVRTEIARGPLARLGPGTIVEGARLKRELTQIRRRGYVIAPGSVEAVSTGVAVPLREDGIVIAAVSVILPRDADPAEALAALREAAVLIERALARNRPRAAN